MLLRRTPIAWFPRIPTVGHVLELTVQTVCVLRQTSLRVTRINIVMNPHFSFDDGSIWRPLLPETDRHVVMHPVVKYLFPKVLSTPLLLQSML
jgi:hypothetical protein